MGAPFHLFARHGGAARLALPRALEPQWIAQWIDALLEQERQYRYR
jgi:hypothetical protein